MTMADLKGVELARPGVWNLASGKTEFTSDHLRDAADFFAATGGQKVPLALGHSDPRFTGDPSFGSVTNVHYEEDDRGPVLKGDLVDMPQWLHAAAPKRWPNRSIEGFEGFEYDGRNYKLVLTGLALLGATPPGVMNIKSLQDLQLALAASAARRIVAAAPTALAEHVLDASGLRCLTCVRPGGSRRRAVQAHLPGKHDQSSHGRHGASGAASQLAGALANIVPDGQSDHSLGFGDDDQRFFDWSSVGEGRTRTWEIGNEHGESVQLDLHEPEMRQLASAMSVTLLRNEIPPPDPKDRQSTLLASLMLAGDESGVVFGESDEIDEKGRYFDWSSRGEDGRYELEVGTDSESLTVELSSDEFAQLHAQLIRGLLPPAGKDQPDGA